jgi:hypothetical protein
MTTSDGPLEDRLRALFGDNIYEYPDSQAIEDGILIPYITKNRDTGHRITTNAFTTLQEHHRANGYADYTDAQFYRFFFAELLPLVPEAHREYNRRGILKTDYDFQVTKATEPSSGTCRTKSKASP